MPRKKKIIEVDTPDNVNIEGPSPKIEVPETITGNSNLDHKLLTLPEQSNLEAVDTALLLQQLVRGQKSMLDNLDKYGTEVVKLRERMDKYDEVAEKFEKNKEAFINETIDRANSLKRTGLAQDKLVASGTIQYQQAIQEQRAHVASDNLAFEDMLARMPRVTVVSPGKMEVIIQGGQNVPTIVPEEIRIKHKRWILPPGQAVEVPEIVAEALKNRRRLEAENDARSGALQKNMNNDQLISEMKKIDREYGIKHEE